jgi:L-rhamnose-H+ transport protein
MPGPLLGLIYHWLGGLAAGSFYMPFKRVRGWSWETYWLVGGVFSWIVAPWAAAGLLVPDLWTILLHSPHAAVYWAVVFGLLWGVGGLTFGLSVRYLGMSLGVAMALGWCAVFGTLIPPIYEGTIHEIAGTLSGRWVLFGVLVCVAGILISALAGMSKERELSPERKSATVEEFNFAKGVIVAGLCGLMSACFAFGLAAGKPVASLTRQVLLDHGRSVLWQNLPVLILILIGGFYTNFGWCLFLNLKNRSWHEYLNTRHRRLGTASAPAPFVSNYLLSALAGVTWYLQFFFYSMGQTKMGRFEFSSWTLHMASIILFSTLWGIALKEWAGTSRRTHALVTLGILTLVLSTVVIGYGNWIGSSTFP